MPPPIVVRAERLGKQYRIGTRAPNGTAREALSGVAARLFGRHAARPSPTPAGDTIWALEDVTFDVRAGDTVALVGRNGAGKSTLLKVLSQITDPTTGFAEVTGRIGSLLEVGTGFHADLTGRENTYVNGAILGMRKAEIDRKFDEIVAFAEVERFIDTPVKYYSSGMYMRLAFAVAAHLDTEILVVDEVLAVGDSAFQRKCLGKMDDVARHGRTVFFVSHNMDAVLRLCARGMLLDGGRLVASGSASDVIAQYRTVERRLVDAGRFNARRRSGTGWARITDLTLIDAGGRPTGAMAADRDLCFDLSLAMADPSASGASLRGLVVHLVVCSDKGQPIVSLMNVGERGADIPSVQACRLTLRLEAPTFIPGRYRVNAFVGFPSIEHVDEIPDALEFDILPPERPWRPYGYGADSGIVCRIADWTCLDPTAGRRQLAEASTSAGR